MEFGFGTPFAEQLDFFRRKLNLPSERWDDIVKSAHDRAFIVAGAGTADLVNDLRQAIEKRIEDGGGLAAFRKEFREIVQRNGWTGWTGEGSKAGEAWRTKIIYQTNMATSYAAGRYKQLMEPAFRALRPFWRYMHNDSVMHPRPLHQLWGNIRLTLRWDHPFWKKFFPPNGWGCQCWVIAVEAPVEGDATEPPDGWDTIDPKTGAPFGIDKGFDYAPGASANRLMQDFIDNKLINLDAPVGAAMWQALQPTLAAERQLAWWDTLDTWLTSAQAGRTAVVGVIEPAELIWLAAEKEITPTNAAIGIREGLIRGTKQSRHEQAQDALLPGEWRRLPEILSKPEAVYFDTRTGKLIYIVSAGDDAAIKLSIEFDYARKGEAVMNMIVSGFRQAGDTIEQMVKGGLLVPLK